LAEQTRNTEITETTETAETTEITDITEIAGCPFRWLTGPRFVRPASGTDAVYGWCLLWLAFSAVCSAYALMAAGATTFDQSFTPLPDSGGERQKRARMRFRRALPPPRAYRMLETADSLIHGSGFPLGD
jgi:hypothetical protein